MRVSSTLGMVTFGVAVSSTGGPAPRSIRVPLAKGLAPVREALGHTKGALSETIVHCGSTATVSALRWPNANAARVMFSPSCVDQEEEAATAEPLLLHASSSKSSAAAISCFVRARTRFLHFSRQLTSS